MKHKLLGQWVASRERVVNIYERSAGVNSPQGIFRFGIKKEEMSRKRFIRARENNYFGTRGKRGVEMKKSQFNELKNTWGSPSNADGLLLPAGPDGQPLLRRVSVYKSVPELADIYTCQSLRKLKVDLERANAGYRIEGFNQNLWEQHKKLILEWGSLFIEKKDWDSAQPWVKEALGFHPVKQLDYANPLLKQSTSEKGESKMSFKETIVTGVKLGGALAVSNKVNKIVVSHVTSTALDKGVSKEIAESPWVQGGLALLGPMGVAAMAGALGDKLPHASLIQKGCQLAVAKKTSDVAEPLMDGILPMLKQLGEALKPYEKEIEEALGDTAPEIDVVKTDSAGATA